MSLKTFITSSKTKINKSSTNKNVEDLFEVEDENNKNKHGVSDMSLWKYWILWDDDKTIWIVNDIFLNSMIKKASDIHIEPREKKLRIRFSNNFCQ